MDALRTLLIPLREGAPDAPSPDAPWLFLNARADPQAEPWREGLLCEQTLRGPVLELEAGGWSVAPTRQETGLAGALLLVPRSRDQARHWLARAASQTAPGAPILIAGARTDGIAPLRKWAAGFLGESEARAKHHATVVTFRSPAPEVAAAMLAEAPAGRMADGFAVPAGAFSGGGVDRGTARLSAALERLPLAGRVADLGAGWGALSVAALAASPRIEAIELFEADRIALDAAERNLAAIAHPATRAFHWWDAVREPLTRRFDAVVMNPPFHESRAAEPELGVRFIAAASAALRPGGRLAMVANRQLPYERPLGAAFRQVEMIEQSEGFKLFLARR